MRHSVSGRKLNRTASHKRALMTNMATSLFEHKKLKTTVAKAKELRPFAEHLITRAKNAYAAEKSGAVSGIDVHSRRMVGRHIRNKAVLQELFDTIAPLVAERNGGYTRIIKLGKRRGDSAQEAIIELVDFSNPQDGRVASRSRKTQKTAKQKPMADIKAAAPAPVEEVAEEVTEEVTEEVVDEVVTEEAAAEAPAEEVVAEAAAEETAEAAEESSEETSEEESSDDAEDKKD